MSLKTVLRGELFLVCFVITVGLGAIVVIVSFAVKADEAEMSKPNGKLVIERDEKNGVTCYERRGHATTALSCVRDVPDAGCPR